jgi:hypothetical protein
VEVGIVVSGSGVPAVVESGELLVGAGAVIAGVGWTVVARFVDGALVVSPGWLHPYSNNPTSALTAISWIFRSDFILRYFSDTALATP